MKNIVVVSGGFDPIHSGHIKLIEEASNYGSVVVLLNSDQWLRRKKGKEFHFKLPATHNSFVYLVDGEIIIGEKKHDTVKGSTLILLNKGEELKIKSKLNSKFLLISGKPINEEIARGGPFVMNTKSEILEAVNDYHNGTFVK